MTESTRRKARPYISDGAFREARIFLNTLKNCRRLLTAQEIHTLRGQALAGDLEGAQRGLQKLLGRK